MPAVLLATAPELEGYGGRCFEDNREARVVPEIYDVVYGVLPWAVDPDAAARLWDVSIALVDAEVVRLGWERGGAVQIAARHQVGCAGREADG